MAHRGAVLGLSRAAAVLILCAGSAPGRAEPRPVSLARAYRLALRNNPTLQSLDARVAQAAAERRRAWVALKPTVAAAGSFTYNYPEARFDYADFAPLLPPGTPVPDPVVIQKREQFAVDVEAALPLFRGPAYPRIGIARKAVEQAKWRRVRSRRDFLLRVARAYYLALGRKEAVVALEEKVVVDRKNLKVAGARVELGEVPRSEGLRAELVLTQDEQSLRRQRLTLESATRRLAILVGLPGQLAVSRPPEPPSPPVTPSVLVQSAVNHRADLKASALAVAAAKQGKAAAWWSFAPTLDASFRYRWQQAAGFAGQEGTYALGVRLALPLYDGGLRYADLRRARADVLEATAQQRELTRTIKQQIARLRAELLSAEAALISATKALALAKTTAEEMTARYEAGTATQLDVLDAAQRRLRADLDLTRSRYTRDLARLALAHASGRFDPLAAPTSR